MIFFMWDLRTALIASLTIPISILIALVLMDIFGIALTVMSIGGLAIGIGKMANGSIIMVENIFRVLNEKKGQASTLDLTMEASKDVGTYLFSANLIIILVFLPLLTLQGIEGAMFRPTAFAVVAALFGALVVNLTLQPVLASFVLTEKHVKERRNPVTEWVNQRYRTVLTSALERKTLVLAVVAFILIGTVVAYSFLGTEFVPPLDEGAIMASSVMLPETSLDESLQGRATNRRRFSFPSPKSYPSRERPARPKVPSTSTPSITATTISSSLPLEERDRGFEEITQAMRVELDKIPGVTYIFEQPIANRLAEMLTGTEGQLSVKLFGPDLTVLNHLHRGREKRSRRDRRGGGSPDRANDRCAPVGHRREAGSSGSIRYTRE